MQVHRAEGRAEPQTDGLHPAVAPARWLGVSLASLLLAGASPVAEVATPERGQRMLALRVLATRSQEPRSKRLGWSWSWVWVLGEGGADLVAEQAPEVSLRGWMPPLVCRAQGPGTRRGRTRSRRVHCPGVEEETRLSLPQLHPRQAPSARGSAAEAPVAGG